MGLARGMGLAVRKEEERVVAAAELGVWAPVGRVLVFVVVAVPAASSEERSGVPGRLVAVLKLGRRREVKEGEGGSGVGGRL